MVLYTSDKKVRHERMIATVVAFFARIYHVCGVLAPRWDEIEGPLIFLS